MQSKVNLPIMVEEIVFEEESSWVLVKALLEML